MEEEKSKIFQEIVKIIKYDPIEKIKTSESLSDVEEVLNLCRKIARSVIISENYSNSTITVTMNSSEFILSGNNVIFLLKLKQYAAFELKKLIICEAIRNLNYVNIGKNKKINISTLWKKVAKKEGIEDIF